MTDEQKAAIERLQAALPYVFAAFQEIKEDAKPAIFLGSLNEDGSGNVTMTIDEPEALLQDIALVTGLTLVPTEEQRIEYMAHKFMKKFGL